MFYRKRENETPRRRQHPFEAKKELEHILHALRPFKESIEKGRVFRLQAEALRKKMQLP